MQSKGVIEASGYPACFSAMPFEKVLDLVVKSNIEEAERMIQNKEELLSTWQSITHNNSEKLTSGKKRGHSKKWNNKTRS